MARKSIFLLFLALIFICCRNNRNEVNFRNYPKEYKIAYFDEIEIKNIPSVRDLFGGNALFNDEFMGSPVAVIIESCAADRHNFSCELLLRVIETEYDIVRMNVKFEADAETKKSYLKDFKIESLLSGQIIEKTSDGSKEQDVETFGYFLRYMEMFWK